MKKVIYYSMSALLALLIFACSPFDEQLDIEEEQTTEVVDVDALNVPDGFHYETNKTVHLNIKMPTTIEFDDYRSRFSILTDTEANNGDQLVTGSFDNNGEFSDIVTVPMVLDKLYFKSVVTDSLIPISSAYIDDEFVTIDLRDFYNESYADSFPYDAGRWAIQKQIADRNTTSGLVNGDFSEDDFDHVENFAQFTPGVEKWNFVIGGIGNTPMTWYEEDGNGFVGTTNSGTHQYGVVQTFPVSAGDLVDFQIQVKAVERNGMHSFYRVFARNDNGGVLGFASLRYSFPAYEWTTKNVMLTIPAGATYCTVEAIGGDWTPWGRILFDNFSASGTVDADGDGVEDELDEFPNDPTRAFSYYFPSDDSYGTLAFEDTWPSRGDYDFNDMVVDYQYRQIMNADNKMVALEVEYKVKAAGAGYHNGIGFQMEVNPNMIASVTGTSLQSGYVTTNSNGTEAGQSKATIIMLDNVYNIMSYPGSGIGINTSPNAPYVQPQSVIATIEFTEPIDIDEAGYAPYNPFLIINGERGKEVHLPGYPPTDLVDTSYFGTMNDDTNLALGKYYLTTANLPWGINLPQSFDYPAEGEEILGAYLRFGQWAQSSGFSFMDWYTNNSGYRNSNKIYNR